MRLFRMFDKNQAIRDRHLIGWLVLAGWVNHTIIALRLIRGGVRLSHIDL